MHRLKEWWGRRRGWAFVLERGWRVGDERDRGELEDVLHRAKMEAEKTLFSLVDDEVVTTVRHIFDEFAETERRKFEAAIEAERAKRAKERREEWKYWLALGVAIAVGLLSIAVQVITWWLGR